MEAVNAISDPLSSQDLGCNVKDKSQNKEAKNNETTTSQRWLKSISIRCIFT